MKLWVLFGGFLGEDKNITGIKFVIRYTFSAMFQFLQREHKCLIVALKVWGTEVTASAKKQSPHKEHFRIISWHFSPNPSQWSRLYHDEGCLISLYEVLKGWFTYITQKIYFSHLPLGVNGFWIILITMHSFFFFGTTFFQGRNSSY